MHIFLRYLTKIQFTKMQLATWSVQHFCGDGKKMVLCTQSFKISCHPDFNWFWHTHLRAVGRGGDTTLQCESNKRSPSAACSGSCGQSATGAAADEDGSCCRCRKRQVPSCSLLPSSPCVDSIAVCPAQSLCGYHSLSPRRSEYGERLGCS